MALLTPRHVISAYHDLVLVEEHTGRMLEGALLELKGEQDRHKRTKRQLRVAYEDTERANSSIERLQHEFTSLTEQSAIVVEENQRLRREISILRSQI